MKNRTGEGKIQDKTVSELEKAGWYVVKLIKTNKNGITDLIILRAGRYVWIEVKTEKGAVRPLQKYRHQELIAHGAEVLIARGSQDIAHLL